jgi:hypothetical protein
LVALLWHRLKSMVSQAVANTLHAVRVGRRWWLPVVVEVWLSLLWLQLLLPLHLSDSALPPLVELLKDG